VSQQREMILAKRKTNLWYPNLLMIVRVNDRKGLTGGSGWVHGEGGPAEKRRKKGREGSRFTTFGASSLSTEGKNNVELSPHV